MGNSLEVQWLGLHALTAEGPCSIPVGELRSHKSYKLHTTQHSQKKEILWSQLWTQIGPEGRDRSQPGVRWPGFRSQSACFWLIALG